MSQQLVESVIGRLACDEEYRARFAQNRAALIEELVGRGLPLTPVERRALLEIDCSACEDFAAHLDPRILKVDLRKTREAR
ncbi:MAG TPA: Os1348 family NHLP clan protein [Vicinamibacteria bacterium]|nr:Os1348 family NHLP clan protein [Vicinamibacteria bacterium]